MKQLVKEKFLIKKYIGTAGGFYHVRTDIVNPKCIDGYSFLIYGHSSFNEYQFFINGNKEGERITGHD